MSKLPQCYGCENFDWKANKCEIYNLSIPEKIRLDITICEHLLIKTDNATEDFPIAKGR